MADKKMTRHGGGQPHEEYQIKPKQKEKFKPGKAKEIIQEALKSALENNTWTSEIPSKTKNIADDIKYKLKDLQLPRYKFMVNVIVGEQKGQGVKVGTRMFWDYDTDYMAYDYFINESLFCIVTVYGVYLY